MKKSRYAEGQIFQILKEAEAGIPVPELCRKYGGMDVSNMKRMKELEQENARLKKMYPKGIDTPRKNSKQRSSSRLSKKSGGAISTQRNGRPSSCTETRIAN